MFLLFFKNNSQLLLKNCYIFIYYNTNFNFFYYYYCKITYIIIKSYFYIII